MNKKTKVFAGLIIGLATAAVVARADWDPGDPHKMHFPQLPDPNGWDVNFTALDNRRAADDWLCTQSGPVGEVHFWLSFRQDIVAPILAINMRIHSDIPDPDGPGELYSHPGEQLWAGNFSPAEFTLRPPGIGSQGWFDPAVPQFNRPDHTQFFQVNVQNIKDPFIQVQGTIYWLDIQVTLDHLMEPLARVGWKTSLDHWNDDGVYWTTQGEWGELRDPLEPIQSLDLAFVVNVPEPSTVALLAMGALIFAVRRRR